MTPVKFRGDLWHHKSRVRGLSCGVVCVILRLAVLVELRLVTDRQTQTDTGPWLVPRMHSIRGNKTKCGEINGKITGFVEFCVCARVFHSQFDQKRHDRGFVNEARKELPVGQLSLSAE